MTDNTSIVRRLRQILESNGRVVGVTIEVKPVVALLRGKSASDAELQFADRHGGPTNAKAGLESEAADLNERARQTRSSEEGDDVMAASLDACAIR